MQSLKELASRVFSVLLRVVKSRVFAAAVLCCATLAMCLVVSVNSRIVTVSDGEEKHVVVTMQSDPYKVLDAAGVELGEYDECSAQLDAEEPVIEIQRAMTVQVNADGLGTVLYLVEGTVQDAFTRAAITVGAYDTVTPALSTPLSDGMVVKVDRVAYREYTKTQSIPYETQTKYSSTLAPGKTRVSQNGANGVRTVTFRETIINGKVASTDKVGEAVTQKPVNKIILKGLSYGTPMSKAPFNIEFDESGKPIGCTTVYSGKCTAYSGGGHTATGKLAQVGIVAVNPKIIPYGTKLWIASADGKFVYGYAIAGDTGGGVRSGKLLADLYMDTEAECLSFGRRTLNVYVLG